MTMKTNFAFEVQYLAESSSTETERNELMDSLQATLQQLLAAQDSVASVAISDSQKGNGNKLVELTTTLDDAQVTSVLKAFSEQHGVSVTAFE
ncbi:hypothetical protein BH10PSE16_BH10PSE16_34850 [soil metagenome]